MKLNLLNRIFKTKSKLEYNMKNLDYQYIDTNNYSNVLYNIFNSSLDTDSKLNLQYSEAIDFIRDQFYKNKEIQISQETILKFINSIYIFTIHNDIKLYNKTIELINKYNLQYTIYTNNTDYIVSLTIDYYTIFKMIIEILYNDEENPIYNIIVSNVENVIDEKILLLSNLQQEDIDIITLEGFSNIDYYYSNNKILPNKIIDDNLHIYTLEDHYINFKEQNDINQLSYSINDTISNLFYVIVALDNVNSKEIRDLLLSNNTNYITINKNRDNDKIVERLILQFNQYQIDFIIKELLDYISKYKEDNNKLNLVMDATLIYKY